jgi:aryl-alcohol dehydrogenase-like predicted oxidoreductase
MLTTHHLPGTDLTVSALCYGAMGHGLLGGDLADRLFGQFRDAGGNFFDTAHCYCFWIDGGLGASERVLGEAVRRHGCRDRVVIASKGGHPGAGDNYPKPDAFISAETVAGDLDDSLSRLRMDVIDLYYLHRDDPRMPAGAIIEILNAEVKRGRIRYLGASNWTAARIAEANAYAAAHGLRGFAASQPQWSLATRNPGGDPTMRSVTPEDFQWHVESGLPVIPYTPTAGGYFAGRAAASFDNSVSQVRRERATSLAADLGCSPTALALAWLMHQPFPTIPIIGTVNPDHLADALSAADVRLSAEQVKWLKEGMLWC